MNKDRNENFNKNDIYTYTNNNIFTRTNPCFSLENNEEKHKIINKGTLINSINNFNIPKFPEDSSNNSKTNYIKNINIINCNESSLFNNNNFNNELLLKYNINNNLINNNNINNILNNSNININIDKNQFNNNYKDNPNNNYNIFNSSINYNNKFTEFNFNKKLIDKNNFIQINEKIDIFKNDLNEIPEDNSNFSQNQFLKFINNLKMPLTKFLSTKKGIYQIENYLNVNKNVNISLLLLLLNKEGLSKLMKNIFGNYFIQGIIQKANYSQIKLILSLISDNFVEISENNCGTYVIQKLLGKVDNFELRFLIIKSIENKELEMALDSNATYVLQKIIEVIPDIERINLNNIIINNFVFLSFNSDCVFIVEKFIDSLTIIENKIKIMNLICLHCIQLSNNPFGNYLIQYIIKKWKNEDIQNIRNIIIENSNYMIQQKFSSNVIEKSLEIFDYYNRKLLIWKMCVEDDILSIIKNQYGHYVLNKTIKYMDDNIKNEIEKKLTDKMQEMTKKEKSKSKKFIAIMKSNKNKKKE